MSDPGPRTRHVSSQFSACARAREDEQNVKIQILKSISSQWQKLSIASRYVRTYTGYFARTTEKPRLEKRSEATRPGCPARSPGRGAPLVPDAAAVAGSR